MAELDFQQRLERLILQPDSIDRLWVKVSSPLLRLFGVKAAIETKHISAFVEAWSGDGAAPSDAARLWEAARREFARNLTSLERARQLYGDVDPRLLNWMLRLWVVLERTNRVAEASVRGEGDKAATRAQRRALANDAHRGLAPLDVDLGAQGATKLAAIEAVLDAAHAERDFLGRRRNMLEAARELLLDSAARVRSAKAVSGRLGQVAREIAEIDRLEALGVQSNVGLLHQLEAARAEGSSQRVNAILSALESYAVSEGDGRVAELTDSALQALWRGNDRHSREHQLRSLQESGGQTFQPAVLEAARRGYLRARDHYEEEKREKRLPQLGDYFTRVALSYLNENPETELIQSALYVDGCVDVGGVLSPHRVFEPIKLVREVRHPTQKLTLTEARGVEDLPSAIIADPRTVVMDLATDRLLTRRYLGEETRHVERRVMASEVRIFLLDGSGSMLGPRARMRDAILVAELSTMLARLNDKERWLTPTLYYRYFNDQLGEVVKVYSAEDALRAVEDVLSRFRHGGTNIGGALVGSFETLRSARQSATDELARAQIVLITDGDAPVNEQAISEARESIAALPIGVSIIALGEENPALKALAERQRERGERVFYQFLDDAVLERLVQGERLSLSLHLPEELAKQAPSQALNAVLDEIRALHRERDQEALAGARDEQQALAEVGLSLRDLSKSEQARALALSRDVSTLEERFLRWFPRLDRASHADATPEPPGEHESLALLPSEEDAHAVQSIQGLLTAVVEVTELIGSEPLQKRVDAVELFERLLMERRMSFVHYQKLLERYPAAFAAPLAALHRAVGRARA